LRILALPRIAETAAACALSARASSRTSLSRAEREAALWGRLAARAVPSNWRSQMAWSVSTVEDIDIGEGFIPSPGFTIQEDGRSPSLIMLFEDLKTAEQCASAMRQIINKATEIVGRDP
jgi:hypothetical protein